MSETEKPTRTPETCSRHPLHSIPCPMCSQAETPAQVDWDALRHGYVYTDKVDLNDIIAAGRRESEERKRLERELEQARAGQATEGGVEEARLTGQAAIMQTVHDEMKRLALLARRGGHAQNCMCHDGDSTDDCEAAGGPDNVHEHAHPYRDPRCAAPQPPAQADPEKLKAAHALTDTVWSYTAGNAPAYNLLMDLHAAIDAIVAPATGVMPGEEELATELSKVLYGESEPGDPRDNTHNWMAARWVLAHFRDYSKEGWS